MTVLRLELRGPGLAVKVPPPFGRPGQTRSRLPLSMQGGRATCIENRWPERGRSRRIIRTGMGEQRGDCRGGGRMVELQNGKVAKEVVFRSRPKYGTPSVTPIFSAMACAKEGGRD